VPLCERIISGQNSNEFTDLIEQLEALLAFFHAAEEVKTSSC